MGWIIGLFICIIILIIILSASSNRRREKSIPQPTAIITPVGRRQTSETEIEQLLSTAYTNRQRLTMKYQTGNPLPGESAIKIRDVDVYGLSREHGYFDAYCHYRKEIRTFKVSRVLWVHLSQDTYEIPRKYVESTWVTEGCGEIEDEEPASNEEVSPKMPPLPSNLKYHSDSVHKPPKRSRIPRRGTQHEHIDETPRTYTRHDWQKHFEESIHTLFPDEWSPALPYLYEARRLELEGAEEERIREVLEKAREADSRATDFYNVRRMIIRKMQGRSNENSLSG